MAKTHGLAIVNGKRTRINRIWKQIRQRCLNPNDSAYSRYGGNGICIAPDWDSFVNFHTWSLLNGYADDLEIDRKDNNKGYSPDNCRWVTLKMQARNKSNNLLITFNGETLTAAEWSEKTGICYGTIKSRINKLKWHPVKALSTPARAKCKNK